MSKLASSQKLDPPNLKFVGLSLPHTSLHDAGKLHFPDHFILVLDNVGRTTHILRQTFVVPRTFISLLHGVVQSILRCNQIWWSCRACEGPS